MNAGENRGPRRPRAAAVAAGALIAISVALSLSYWPGLMIWDSIRQYDQALSGRFDDWHPPLMEWVWRLLTHLGPGPAPMLLLQLAIYAAGFGLLAAWALNQRRPRLGIALAASSLTPIAVALMGAIIKDSLMAALLLAAAGLLAWRRQDERDAPLRIAGVALVILACTLRFNAFVAGGPLAAALLPERLRRTPLRLVLTTTVATLALLLPMPVANHLLGAQRSDVGLSLVIFDLGGITERAGKSVFPPLPVKDPVAANDDCYSPVRWDLYADWAEDPCPVGFEPVRKAFREQGIHPTLFWARAILGHPIAYAEHRLRHFNVNTRFLVRGPVEVNGDVVRPVYDRSNPNRWSYQVAPNPLQDAVDAVAMASARTPLGWPIFWMALAAGLLTLAHRLPSRRLIWPLALSSLLYGLGYAVVSVSSEVRYHLWTMLAALLAACIAFADFPTARASLKRRELLIAATPASLVAVVGLAWRLWPA